eukprot:gene13540-14944_t
MGKYAAISCDFGTFNENSLLAMINVHRLSDIATKVREEQRWLNSMLSEADFCLNVKNDLLSYKLLLEKTPDGQAVFDYNKAILANDIATLAGREWTNFSIISGVVKLMNNAGGDTYAFILNDLLLMNKKQLCKLVYEIEGSPKYLLLVSNVGKSKETFLSTPSRKGCHWTFTFVDLEKKQWFYCDTLGWAAPNDLRSQVNSVTEVFYEVKAITSRPFRGCRPFRGFINCHIPSKTGNHACVSECFPNFPFQTCGNICGIIVIVLAGIAVRAPDLWKNVFLSRSNMIPDELEWLLDPSTHSDRLRVAVISWLLQGRIDVHALGISESVLNSIPLALTKQKPVSTNVYIPRTAKKEFPGTVSEQETSMEQQYIQRRNSCKEQIREDAASEEELTEMIQLNTSDTRKNEGKTSINSDIEKVSRKKSVREEEIRADAASEEELTEIIQLNISDTENNEEETNINSDIENMSAKETVREEEVIQNEPDRKEANQRISENSNPKEITLIKNGQGGEMFYVGQHFMTLKSLEKAKEKFEDNNFCQLWKRDVRTLEAAAKRVPKRVAVANNSLIYYSMKLSCKFGGKECKSREHAKRVSSSFRQKCPFEICLMLSQDGKSLEVTKRNDEHNHATSNEVYNHLPRQRNINGNLKDEIKDVIRLKANSKLIQQKIQTATGRPITLKDIANLKAGTKRSMSSNEMEAIIPFLKEKQGSSVEVAVDEQHNFKCIFYQDRQMKSIYNLFPEFLMVDATYKLLDLKLPVYVLLIVDGNGLSEIVGIFIVAEETEATIETAVNFFKENNPAWEQTQVIMSDKDFGERNVFSRCFPQAAMQICLYHALRTFRREVTMEKMGITSAERMRCLELLSKIIYSKSPAEYDSNVNALKATEIQSVIAYYEENWGDIKDQWVSCFKDSVFNLGETTNNRLESLNAKIKSVCSRYGSMLQFFTEFFSVLNVLRNERNHARLMSRARRPTQLSNFDEDLQKYANHVTSYAFKHITNQAELATHLKIEKSSQQENIRLVRCLLEISKYDESLVACRWTLKYCENKNVAENVSIDAIYNEEPNISLLESEPLTKLKPITEAQKYKRALKIAQNLASVACEGGMELFCDRISQMEKLLAQWRNVELDTNVHQGIFLDKLLCERKDVNMEKLDCISEEKDMTCDELSVEVNMASCEKSNTEQESYKSIKMSSKMLKRGRPKGAELTVIGLPCTKKAKTKQGSLKPFVKLWAEEKDRVLLECFVGSKIAKDALKGIIISPERIQTNVHNIPDLVRDSNAVDINRIERYFSDDAWMILLDVVTKKRNCKWICPTCSKKLKNSEDCVCCERCLSWFHFTCVSIRKKTKAKNWFCRNCKSKYK